MAKSTSFYHFLIRVLKDRLSQNEQSDFNGSLADINDIDLISSRDNMPTIFYLLKSLKDKKAFLERVVSKFNAEITDSENGIFQDDIDSEFLRVNKQKSYFDFFNDHFSEGMLDSELSSNIKIILEKTQASQLNNNNIIDDSNYEPDVNKNSFCYYLAETVKEVFFAGLDIPVTLQGIKNFIESLWLEDQEETRIKFIQTLCQMYQADEKKPKQNSNDNTDRLFLESVACKNFTIFLNGYLPLSKDDNIQSPIYTRIGHVGYPFNLDIEKREFPVVKLTKSTKPTVVRKELQEEKTSFYPFTNFIN